MVKQVERAHQTDLFGSYQQNEIICALACGGPHLSNLTKITSDEFNLPRMLKDKLDILQLKFCNADKDGSTLYTIGIQV